MLKTEGERLDDLFAKTDVEMQRLNLTVNQGRALLVKLYGKRSRLMLTEDELDNFLLYLQLSEADESPTPNTQCPTKSE